MTTRPLVQRVDLDISTAERQLNDLERQLAQLNNPVTVPVDVESDQSLDQLRRDIAQVDAETVSVDVDVAGVDRAESEFNQLNSELNQADAQLEQVASSADRAGRELDQAGRRASGGISDVRGQIGFLAASVAGFVGGTAVIDFLRDSVDAAADFEESMSKANVVFGTFSDDIQTFAGAAPQSLGLSTQAALEATATFGNLFSALGLSQQAAAELSPQIVTLASDLASFNNIQVQDAVEKLRAGLVGEVEPLRTLGVNLNAAAVEAKALELGLVNADGAVTEAGKVQARYQLILEQTVNAQGDFIRTADSFSNSMRTTAAEVQNAQVAIGQALQPALAGVLPVIVAAAESTAILATAFGEMVGFIDPATAAIRTFQIQTGSTEANAQALLAIITKIAESGLGLRPDLDAAAFEQEVIDIIRLMDLTQAEIDRFASQEGRQFLLQAGVDDEQIDRFIAVLREDFKQAQVEARDQLLHSEIAIERWQRALEGVSLEDTLFDQDAFRGREDVSRELLTEAEALEVLGQAADLAGVSINQFIQDKDAQSFAETQAIAALSEGTLAYLAQVDAINVLSETIGTALPGALDAAAAALETKEGEIVESFGTFLDNLRTEIESREAFETNLAILRVLDLENLAAVFDEKGIEANKALAEAVADPEAAREAEDLLTGQFSPVGNQVMEDIQAAIDESTVVDQALVDNLIAAAEAADTPAVREALTALAEELSRELILRPTIADITPSEARAARVPVPTNTGGGGGNVTVEQNFYTEPAPTPETQRAAQEAAAIARGIRGAG